MVNFKPFNFINECFSSIHYSTKPVFAHRQLPGAERYIQYEQIKKSKNNYQGY